MMIKTAFLKFWYGVIRKDKAAYARKQGVRIGTDAMILASVPECFGTEPWLITIGNDVEITRGVQFLTHEGGMWVARHMVPEIQNGDVFRPISVGSNVMIGMNSIIMPGVHIGDNVIIGGHSIVTKDVPSNSIYGGQPAKKISDLNHFLDKAKQNAVPTKKMTHEQKRRYLMKLHPEWFTR